MGHQTIARDFCSMGKQMRFWSVALLWDINNCLWNLQHRYGISNNCVWILKYRYGIFLCLWGSKTAMGHFTNAPSVLEVVIGTNSDYTTMGSNIVG